MTIVPAVLRGKRLVVVDVEGNGQQPPEIIELAALPIDDPDTATDTALRTWLIRPRRPVTPLVTRKVHGITNADIETCPPWPAVANDVQVLLDDRILVAHSAAVEYRVLREHLPTWNPPLVLDTLRLAKHCWPGQSSYALNQLTTHAQLPTLAGQQPHRAGYDAWSTWQLLCRLLTDTHLGWPSLITIAALPGQPAPDPDADQTLW